MNCFMKTKSVRKPQKKVPVQAWHRSDGAFLTRLALMDEQPESSDISLLRNLSRSILQALSEDQFVYTIGSIITSVSTNN